MITNNTQIKIEESATFVYFSLIIPDNFEAQPEFPLTEFFNTRAIQLFPSYIVYSMKEKCLKKKRNYPYICTLYKLLYLRAK